MDRYFHVGACDEIPELFSTISDVLIQVLSMVLVSKVLNFSYSKFLFLKSGLSQQLLLSDLMIEKR